MGLQAVVFDVDGTLVDSERDGHRVAFNAAFAEAGLPCHWDPERYGELLAVTGGARRIERYLVDERGITDSRALAERLHARKTQLFVEMVRAGAIPARPGALRLLDELRAARVAAAVATTGRAAWVRPLLDGLFGPNRFTAIVCGDDVAARKPDPAAYLAAIDRLGGDRETILAIEDSANGLRAARAAGLQCVVVGNEYSSGEDFGAAALVLDGFGAPGHPAAVLSDRRRVAGDAGLDVATLRRALTRESAGSARG